MFAPKRIQNQKIQSQRVVDIPVGKVILVFLSERTINSSSTKCSEIPGVNKTKSDVHTKTFAKSQRFSVWRKSPKSFIFMNIFLSLSVSCFGKKVPHNCDALGVNGLKSRVMLSWKRAQIHMCYSLLASLSLDGEEGEFFLALGPVLQDYLVQVETHV